MQLLDGKKLAQSIEKDLAVLVSACNDKPSLAVILVGNDPASQTYVNMKQQACERVGMVARLYALSSRTTQAEIMRIVESLNNDEDVHGIIVQLPLPPHIETNPILEAIAPSKDVDGFSPHNVGRVRENLPAFAPATPLGVMELLAAYKIPLQGQHCVIVGASNIVGKPLAALMLNANATVTTCHIYTRDLPSFTRQADILCVAVGKPNLISADMVKEGAVVVDIGITRLPNGKICGDVDFEAVSPKCSFISPVPGGAGPMTIISLLQNTFKAYEIQKCIKDSHV